MKSSTHWKSGSPIDRDGIPQQLSLCVRRGRNREPHDRKSRADHYLEKLSSLHVFLPPRGRLRLLHYQGGALSALVKSALLRQAVAGNSPVQAAESCLRHLRPRREFGRSALSGNTRRRHGHCSVSKGAGQHPRAAMAALSSKNREFLGLGGPTSGASPGLCEPGHDGIFPPWQTD